MLCFQDPVSIVDLQRNIDLDQTKKETFYMQLKEVVLNLGMTQHIGADQLNNAAILSAALQIYLLSGANPDPGEFAVSYLLQQFPF